MLYFFNWIFNDIDYISVYIFVLFVIANLHSNWGLNIPLF